MSTMQVGGVEFDITVDASGVATAKTRAVEDLTKLQKSFKDTDVSVGKTNAAMKKSGSSFQSMGKSAGAAGIQIQQLVGQIQGGQNVFNALSAQAADLGIVLGAPLVGAVAGLGAAFAGILLPSLFDTEDKTQDLIDKLRELADVKIISKEQAALLAQEERKLIKEKEGLVKASEDEVKEQNRVIKVMRDSLARNSDSQIAYENFTKSIKEANEEIVVQQANIRTLNDEIGESTTKLEYYDSIVKGSIEQTNKQAEEINALVSAFEAQADAIGKTDRQLAIKAATEKGATETQLEAINAAFDAIEAEEARAEAVVEARKKAAQAIKDEMQAQKNYEALLDEIAANQKKKDQEKQQEKDRIGSNIDRLKEEFATEEQLRAEAFLTQGEQLREALATQLLTKQEFDELDKARISSYHEWWLAKEAETAEKRKQIEAQAQDAMSNLRRSAVNNAIGLLDQFAGESKVAALASIALTKGMAIAQTLAHTQTAAMLAYSSQLIPGDPTSVARATAAAVKTQSMGKISAALIAATGLAQGASALRGGGSSQSYSGGVPATNTTRNTSDTGGSTQRNISIALTGSGFSGGDIRGLISAINEELGDGVTLSVTGG